jgi:hypothetical protein
MTRTVRFCILCGHEIGDSPSCLNPECEGIPNFYRAIAGPPVRERVVRDGKNGKKKAPGDESSGSIRIRQAHRRETDVAPDRGIVVSKPSGQYPGEDDDRRTIPMSSAPLALLRGMGAVKVEHLIFPGSTEVGARPPAKIILNQPQISRRHASFDCNLSPAGSPQLKLTDHKSTNGTFVNGKKVQEIFLRSGDQIRFANVEFEVLLLAEDQDRRTLAI